MERIKIVVVGDGSTGKTSMLMAYKSKESQNGGYVPTVFDHYEAVCETEEGVKISLGLADTAGQEVFEKLRPLSYPHTDVFLLCYSIASPVSLQNISTKWVPEVRQYCPNALLLLVGTKTDLRTAELHADSMDYEIVSNDEVKQISEAIGASDSLECSARTLEGVDNIFARAVKVVLESRRSNNWSIPGILKDNCSIL